MRGGVAVLDFGGQYSHLIARRVRSLGVYSALLPFDTPVSALKQMGVKGVILSGGPSSVYGKGAPHPEEGVFSGEIPVLGICYGYQLIVQAHGGEVKRAERREYGKAELRITDRTGIFEGIEGSGVVCWMSHGDSATRLPRGLTSMGESDNSPYAAIRSADGAQFGVQFHPEVVQTEHGDEMLSNFVFNVCRAERTWSMEGFLEETVESLRRTPEGRVLCAVSGGVDSSVASVLLNRSLHDRLQCVFIDTGLLRQGEAEEVSRFLRDDLGVPIEFVDASKRFLGALKGLADPEEKRKVIGRVFAQTFEEYARVNGPFRYLAQGTLYPDVIESGHTSAPASVIKTHHNVGGLPKDLKLELIEPLRELYKDEVRALGTLLGIPAAVIGRHPFPGPGLAVRIIGEVTPEKLRLCRAANHVVEQAMREEGLYDRVWQAFAYLGDDRVTGVLGDERRVGAQVTVRVVESVDAMTADWFRMPYPALERLSSRITNEVEGVVSVAYSVSSKPPATIEPQ
ncbi:MAG: glutamine-hydrolyzing GMP synthase [Nitrososphaerota archaeon]|nr:glutamine-hydrolyzing GMP synthase [Nitrososphaerota archaeon]MDG6967203.1 glutamine-hydrolyzing GMP synthase [Nitrososphaerota archaeon]MDG6978838.1 glutamine-hydrolyzing GMP synthase [Nitrososphaerota archaeon]MDG7021244.1 glutamine-hydrolyzing GMP synthase [Nitrososphaerota archaeon]